MSNFQNLEKDPWYSKLLKKLSLKERAFCEKTIEENAHLSDPDFCQMAQRFGSKPGEQDFKNYKIINELLLVSGSK